VSLCRDHSKRPERDTWIARAKPVVSPEPASSSWRCHRVAELHGYLFDLSEPDVLDQADELSALILAIVAQLHQDGDTVLALETADWHAPFDSVPLLGATVNLLDRAASLLCERQARGWHPLGNGIVVRPCDS
jgi:hypothetical protein